MNVSSRSLKKLQPETQVLHICSQDGASIRFRQLELRATITRFPLDGDDSPITASETDARCAAQCRNHFTDIRCHLASAVPTRRVPGVKFHSFHVGKSYATLSIKLNLTLLLTLTLTVTQILLTLLNHANHNRNSKTLKYSLFSTNKSTRPSQRRHVSEYTAHPGL